MDLKRYAPLGIMLGFFALLVPALGQIYHQDEYRWVLQMNGTYPDAKIHPPLFYTLGRVFGSLFGFGHERWVPALFALANVLLVYLVVQALTRRRSVSWVAAGLFALNAYSVIAATQIDIDGALLPFFALLAFLSYLKVLKGDKRWYWGLGFAIVVGFVAKLSFILVVAALAFDWAIRVMEKRGLSVTDLLRKYAKWIVGGLAALGAASLALKFGAPGIYAYATHFQVFDFRHRAYFDLAYKILKSLVLLGPGLFLAGLVSLVRKDSWQRYRFLWLYLVFCTLFYAVVFDFTTLTIERYFMFLIAPFAILAAEPISKLFNVARANLKRSVYFGSGTVLILAILLVHRPFALPLDPKSAYLHAVLAGRLNFLIPVTGGSGPVGLYVPALVVGVAWVVALVALFATFSRRELVRAGGAVVFLCAGLFITLVVLEEFLFGGLYGSPNNIARRTVDYVNANPAIHQQQVITYYDIAAYDLLASGKYYSRFYTTPTRDYTAKVTTFRGYYMIVDFPAISTDDRYWKLIARCPIAKEFKDKFVSSYVFDCTAIK